MWFIRFCSILSFFFRFFSAIAVVVLRAVPILYVLTAKCSSKWMKRVHCVQRTLFQRIYYTYILAAYARNWQVAGKNRPYHTECNANAQRNLCEQIGTKSSNNQSDNVRGTVIMIINTFSFLSMHRDELV